MAQLKPTQWARQQDLKKLAEATEQALQEMYADVVDIQRLREQLGVIAIGLVNLNTAVLEIQQVLFEEADEGLGLAEPEPAEEPEWADRWRDDEEDLANETEEGRATDEGMPERKDDEAFHVRRAEEVARIRREARGAGKEIDAVFEAANASTTAEMAAADGDINAIGGLPDEGVLVSPGEVTPGLTDLGGGSE